MSAFHVVVRPERERAPSPALSPLYGLLDVVVDGVNITARIADGFAPSLLGDLSRAFAALASGRAERTVIQLYAEHDVWELGLERDADDVLITVFRSGPAPVVAVHERRVALSALREGLLSALGDARSKNGTKEAPLAACRASLDTAWPAAPRPKLLRSPTVLTPAPRGSFSFNVSAPFRRTVRARPTVAHGTAVERADLHALLVQGDFAVVARGRTATISGCFPFLVAERLIPLAEEALDAWQSGRAIFRRIQLGDSRIGVRRGPGDGPLDVSLSVGFGAAEGKSVTFPAIDALDFAGAAVAIARRLVEAFTTNDPTHERNLRLKSVAAAVESLADRIEESAADDSVTNPEPETYRSFAPRATTGAAKGPWAQGGKMRFAPSWVATVPAIDLKSTFLCGDRIIVGSARELACLDRRTGTVAWRAPTARGGSIATPSGIARIEPDGKILLRDLETGEIRFSARITPRAAGGATGAVVHAPGLPKLLVVSEGDRSITALDLVTGDVRWRHTSRRTAAYRMRRAGKLLLVTGGDSALVAHDVSSGDVVWRVRDRLPFAHAMTIDHDSAFAVSGAAGGHWRLHHVDPWTGAVKWAAELSEAPLASQPPLVTNDIVAIATRDASGSGIRGFRRSDGALLWEHAPGLLAPLATWLVVDDTLIANSSSGLLLCLDAATGAVRYNHVFAGSADCDQPRRLEPVLRGGALFVPQHQVIVVRPRDGEVIGTVPSDLIPDLLRVDERCDVYVGEESGHLAAFTTAARLSLVR
ncbi:MAG TPA: PQQ-binding-like beta-propeller repeat protein [Polyangiaceae bacterium]|jgi:outer membrane protein assembly factor BamB|nr:PQQ-binding-like beta-propeller repeat protein [Polyangiaceae bacterium]